MATVYAKASALSWEVGVTSEMLVTKAEQVSDKGACAGGYS